MMEGFSVVGSMLKVVAVFVLFWFTLRGLGRLHGQGQRRGRANGVVRPVEVIGRSPLGRKASIVVVRLGTDHVALGVTEGNVTLLGPVDVDQPDAPPAGTQVAAPGPSWREVVSRLQERTVRR
jgi:flagellar biogenesis protein FliO